MIITKDTLTADILKNINGAKEFFESLNMGCLSCMGIQNETLEKSCLMHGLNLEEIMEKLNNLSNQ
ncbi:DUF1858 domain-containing protein [Mucispirillum schaedleri]|jgi:hydrid cluster protein-associated redox disulfide domain|uniref:DUF1858 domain-containing protein n=1 Tax=Mucispirillum schaedleri ASF457 TaxID=1379858 RepID=V2QBW9_9BACT|nr:DUF1858 domain-containing protein [Mucispirillum schaedleri]MCX4360843.1 DUF1858 domain-containing protein [Mucispirillum schaedleri]USF24117.1 hypothetical protein N508_001196 [Mucispirillum schaedleri ASF457]SIW06214.1 conserved hypothetical protein [Mucispirillum schaedleri ASF457]